MGGKATNSGINYQQRIAAWCLINQYTEFDLSIYFEQIEEELIIKTVHFETDSAIDDINLVCNNNIKIFLQVKRTLSLSQKESSDFYKTIFQFVKEFSKRETEKTYYGIITTTDSSSKVTNDLKKLTIAAKLNSEFLKTNPLNESEKDCLEKIHQLFIEIYFKLNNTVATDEQFKIFLKKIFVCALDVEAGKTVEIAAFMLLKSIGFKNPDLIWAVLIKNTLFYSSERLSIDKSKLNGIFEKYLTDKTTTSLEDIEEAFKTEVISMGVFSAAKEVLLIESFIEGFDIIIAEVFRFHDDCRMKNIFKNNRMIIENGSDWKIIQRFATMAGLERYLLENQNNFIDKQIAIIPANGIENEEGRECATLHKALLEELISKNNSPLTCLHCEKTISNNNALLVELDDNDTKRNVGNVHKDCLRPVDRILGIAIIPGIDDKKKYLEYFDYKLWLSLIIKGQGMMNGIKSSAEFFNARTPCIAWNSNEEYDADYSYCIKFILANNSSSYVYQRGKIVRLNKSNANKQIEIFKKNQEELKQVNDPYCILSKSKTVGLYSELLKLKKSNEKVLEILSFEICKYSKQIAKAFDNDIFWYAPLCLLRDKDEETFYNLSNVIPILSDPLNFQEFFENWESLGFNTKDIELKIIKNDRDFDNYMRILFADNMSPIIDPIFDKNFNLVKGFPIEDLEEMKRKFERKNDIH
jgi:hypothetical protein